MAVITIIIIIYLLTLPLPRNRIRLAADLFVLIKAFVPMKQNVIGMDHNDDDDCILVDDDMIFCKNGVAIFLLFLNVLVVLWNIIFVCDIRNDMF